MIAPTTVNPTPPAARIAGAHQYFANRTGVTGFGLPRPGMHQVFGAFMVLKGDQAEERLADVVGRVKSFTEDWLAYTPSPPLPYGNVDIGEGGNIFMEFTDIEPGELAVGLPVRMVFRIKDVDRVRHFHRYFWKATPVRSS